jgi:hypothetical protein
MEPTLMTAEQIADETGMPVPVITELLRGGPLVAFDDGTGDRKYNELDVLRAKVGCQMLGNGVRWAMVQTMLGDMSYYSWDELQQALRCWAPVHPKTVWRTKVTVTAMLVVAVMIGFALGRFL